jgi:hypothetical protein
MAFWANHPGTVPRMPGADEIWRAEDGDAGAAQRPQTRGFFLGQLPDDPPPDDGADDAPEKSPDQFELRAWNDHPDVGGVLQDGSQHVDRLTASLDDALGFSGADELDTAPAPPADEPNGTTTVVEPPIGERRARREARKRRAKIRRSHVGVVAAVVIAVLAGTGLYVGSRTSTGDERSRPPTSTSLGPRSASTVVTTAPAPQSAPAPGTEAAPGSAPLSSQPGAPRAGLPAGPAPGTAAPASGTPPPAPESSAPPSSASPPSAPPRSPMCQLLPGVCP